MPTAQSQGKVISEKRPIVSLVVKSRNCYPEGIRYVGKINCKVTFSKTVYLWIKSGDFFKSFYINVGKRLTESTSEELFV